MEPRPPLERRREPRQAVSAHGRIWFGPTHALWADCRISDRSPSGARIEVPAIYVLPRRLIFAHHGVGPIFEAILKWQRGDAAGLALTACSASTLAQPWFERISHELKGLHLTSIGPT